MFRTHLILTIDIGTHSLKFVVCKQSGQKLILIKLATKDISMEKMESPEEIAFVTASKANEFLTEEQITVKSVNITFSGQSIFARFVQLPIVDKAKIFQIVRYEAQQQVPFPLEEVIWDYQMIDGLSQDQLCVLIVAIKTEIIESLIQGFSFQGFNIDSININPLSIYNTVLKNQSLSLEPSVIIDVGRKTTDFIVIDGVSVWTRSISFAGESITQEIKKIKKVNTAEAEGIKLSEANLESTVSEDPISQSVQLIATRLLAEITRSLGFYRTQYHKPEIKHFYLTGGTSQLKGFQDFLKNCLKSDIQILDPFSSFNQIESTVSDQMLKTPHVFASVVGASFVATKFSSKINLLPKSYIRHQSILKKRNLIMLSFIVAFSIVFMMWGENYLLFSKRKDLLAHIEGQISTIQQFNKKINNSIESIENLNQRLNKFGKLVDFRTFWLDLFIHIEQAMPKNTWLLKINSDKIQIKEGKSNRTVFVLSLQGATRGVYADITDFSQSLEKSDLFQEVKIERANPPVKGIREFILTMHVLGGEDI